jgi:hypothetical protein
LPWIARSARKPGDYLFPSRIGQNKPLTTRHYARLMDRWITSVGWIRPCTARTRCAGPRWP